jgi:hypothetical protein
MFSLWSVPRLYNEGQLLLEKSSETAVRMVRGWCEVAASCESDSWSNESVVRQSPAGKKVSTEADIVQFVTRQRLVKTQQTEKTLCVL